MDLSHYADVIPESDLEAYRKGKHGQRSGFGLRPALMVIDMTYAFVDPSFDLAHGDLGRRAVENIRPLLDLFRSKKMPIIHIKGSEGGNNPADWGISRKRLMLKDMKAGRGVEIVEELAPLEGEVVIPKTKASAFFATNLQGTLVFNAIDTLIMTGVATSGCVRASVVDAASLNYFVVVPEECIADRARVPHMVNMFDMDMKYADVIPVAEVVAHINENH